MGQGVTVNHLVQKCARNLKNERPGNKSAETVIETLHQAQQGLTEFPSSPSGQSFLSSPSSFSSISIDPFTAIFRDRHRYFRWAGERGATGGFNVNRGL